MEESSRHHFIPQFYLRHFTNEKGKFYIYLVKEDKFKGGNQLFSPKQQFYENYANTLTYENVQTDFIEKEFSNIDADVSRIINKASLDHHSLVEREWMMLQYFVNILYWRCPCNTPQVKEYLQSASKLSDLKMSIRNKETNEPASEEEQNEWLKRFQDDPDFYKFIKISLPGITYPEIFEKNVTDFAHIFEFPFSNNLPKLVSDNPIIYRKSGSESLHRDEFIFKLTHSKLLFRHRIKSPQIMSTIRLMVDVLFVMQANQYVSCTDMTYPRLLRNTFERSGQTVEKLRQEIFNMIT